MKQFEKVTQSVDALAEFLSSENKGDNTGCPGCANFEECAGKETCRKGWTDFLNSEVQEYIEVSIDDLPEEISLETFLEMVTSRANIETDYEDEYNFDKIRLSIDVLENLRTSLTEHWKQVRPDLQDTDISEQVNFELHLFNADQDIKPGTVAVHEGFIIHLDAD